MSAIVDVIAGLFSAGWKRLNELPPAPKAKRLAPGPLTSDPPDADIAKGPTFAALLLALLLTACGGSSSSPPPPPPATPWSITAGSAPQPLQVANGVSYFDFPVCASASACWVSYVEQPYGAVAGKTSVTLTYIITGSAPAFVHDSPNNTADGPSTVRLLIEGGGLRLFSVPTQSLQLGSNSFTVSLDVANWQIVDIGGNTVTDASVFPIALSQVTRVGFCFGGGYFACHGSATASGSSRFTISAYGVQ